MIRTICICLALVFAADMSAAANSTGDTRDRTGGAGPSVELTGRVVRILTTELERCGRIDTAFQTDCYKWVFRRAHQELDGNRAYRTAQTAFENVDRALGAFVARNSARPWRLRLHGFQIYRAIPPQAEIQARALLAQALDTTQAALVQAPEQTGDHYMRLAAAIDATMAALRTTRVWRHRILPVA